MSIVIVGENDNYDYSGIGTRVDASEEEKRAAWESAVALAKELNEKKPPIM